MPGVPRGPARVAAHRSGLHAHHPAAQDGMHDCRRAGHRGTQRPGMSAYEPFVASMLQVKLQLPMSSQWPDGLGQCFLSVRRSFKLKHTEPHAFRGLCRLQSCQRQACRRGPRQPVRCRRCREYAPLQALMCSVKVPPSKVSASAQARMACSLGSRDLTGKIMVHTQRTGKPRSVQRRSSSAAPRCATNAAKTSPWSYTAKTAAYIGLNGRAAWPRISSR